ncbi:MAG: glycoside hydrolase family 65 protein [Propionibacteriaceae bacterium]|jgi:alpha,alpha-trehalose phosphorylase|nr:glycoside hydrolase family 65 protein [Propionibacteriaceae bacterium]
MRVRDHAGAIDRRRFPADPWALIDTDPLGKAVADDRATATLFAVSNGFIGLRGREADGSSGTFINGFHETAPIHYDESAYGFATTAQTIVAVPDATGFDVLIDGRPLDQHDVVSARRWIDVRDGVWEENTAIRLASGARLTVQVSRLAALFQAGLMATRCSISYDPDPTLMSQAPVAVEIRHRIGGEPSAAAAGGESLAGESLTEAESGSEDVVYAPFEIAEPGSAPSEPSEAVASGASATPRPSSRVEEGGDPRKAARLTGVLTRRVAQREGSRVRIGVETTSSGMAAVLAGRYGAPGAEFDETVREASAGWVQGAIAPGQTVQVTFTGVYATSTDGWNDALLAGAEAEVAAVGPWDDLVVAQQIWLHDFWAASDIEVDAGDGDETQQAVRWTLFQLACATAQVDGHGVPAKGLTGSGYAGHYFWDTEIFVLPFLVHTAPDRARALLEFRHGMLDAARERARQLSQRGALFPWRTISGEEASSYYPAGTAQYHISADIAYAVMLYDHVTGDEEFLATSGIDLLVETARLFADLGFWDDDEDGPSFHIYGVTGPDEYTAVVNDNLYTNAMAKANLAGAVDALTRLEETNPAAAAAARQRLSITDDEVAEWAHAAEKMALPFDERRGVHCQDAQFLQRKPWPIESIPPENFPLLLHYHPLVIYRHRILKQADTILALFLVGDYFTAEEKRADFDYYDPLTTGDSTLAAAAHAVVAAEVGHEEMAVAYFRDALMVDLANLHGNTEDGVHIAAIGGLWTTLVHGFGGLRDRVGFHLDPHLPAGWERLSLPVTTRGSRIRVTLEPGRTTLALESGEPVVWTLDDEDVEVADATVLLVGRRS